MRKLFIHFIRHGKTLANLKGFFAGRLDYPVCREGIQELAILKEKFRYPNSEIFYSSPLIRCIQTCKVIYPESDPVIINDLIEYDFGDWEGQYASKLNGNQDFINWKEKKLSCAPNGEYIDDFYSRICHGFEKIVFDAIKKQVFSIAVFTHGWVIMSILDFYATDKTFSKIEVKNGRGISAQLIIDFYKTNKKVEIVNLIPYPKGEKLYDKS